MSQCSILELFENTIFKQFLVRITIHIQLDQQSKLKRKNHLAILVITITQGSEIGVRKIQPYQTALPALVKSRGGWGRRPHATRDSARAAHYLCNKPSYQAGRGRGGATSSTHRVGPRGLQIPQVKV